MHLDHQVLPATLDPFSFYQAFSGPTPSALLESARTGGGTGRYSVVADDPFAILRHEHGSTFLERPRTGSRQRITGDPLKALQKLVYRYRVETPEGAPPFSTGAVGYAGYECKDWIEPSVAPKRPKSRPLPDLFFMLFDRSVVWDHQTGDVFVFSSDRTADFRKRVAKTMKSARRVLRTAARPQAMHLESSFDEARFTSAVRKAKDHIRRGDIFQANLSQCLSFDLKERPQDIYARLRRINPSPFFGILDGGDFQIVSGSPERLLKLDGRKLQTRPIAGTRWRGKDAKADRQLGLDLLLSDKERAEHIMLVDLERNDLGRVSEIGSVAVDELMTLEDYSHVKHIVSNVRGTLRRDMTAMDAFRAFFPGGTITGAPKVRCMQIIEQLEPVARGPYTGSMGYFSFTGNMDFNILIRSLSVRNGRAYVNVGAGIVADSDPRKEYHETLYKAEAVLSAVFGRRAVRQYLRRRGATAGIP